MKRRVYFLTLLVFITTSLLADGKQHILQEQETLYRVSVKYGVSVERIIEVNNIEDPTSLPVGMKIIIPEQNTVETEVSANYIVKKGDTFYSVAKRYNTSVDQLLELNNLGSDYVLKIDDVLIIPVMEGEAGEVKVTHTENGTAEETAVDEKVTVVRKEKPSGESSRQEKKISSDITTSFITDDIVWPLIGERKETEGKLAGTRIEGSRGDPVVSISSGEVVWVGPYRGFGKVILIQSPDRYIYVYGGNEITSVKVGDKVQPGMKIGTLGVNPHGEKPLLFFTVFKDGKPVDPEKAPRV